MILGKISIKFSESKSLEDCICYDWQGRGLQEAVLIETSRLSQEIRTDRQKHSNQNSISKSHQEFKSNTLWDLLLEEDLNERLNSSAWSTDYQKSPGLATLPCDFEIIP